MTADRVLQVAAEQSARDCGCRPSDFFGSEPVVLPSRVTVGARAYLHQPLPCNFVSYGNNVVAVSREDLMQPVREYLAAHKPMRAFETPALHEIDDLFAPFGIRSR